MLFNSYIFIFLFLPITFFIWRLFCYKRKTKAALYWLLSASLFFYGYWNPPYLLLLLASITGNYIIQTNIALSKSQEKTKFLLTVGIVLNLSLIGYFKYANFFAENIAPLFSMTWNSMNIFLPLGISFFTFQEIACLMDTYHGKLGYMPFHRYALAVSFFPHLIAGPIVLANKIVPQFSKIRIFGLSWKNLCIAITLFSLGLFKKVIIADTFSPGVSMAFNSSHPLTFIEAWGAALAYTFQIYFDFSGYSDMALGLAKFFNIDLPINFDSPYKSLSITDFWRRWHITLSSFLREYLYIPLGGNRKGKLRRYSNLMTTMLLGGLWHGAGWTFIVWGGLHGLYLTIHHFWKEHSSVKLPAFVGWGMTFLSVVVAWVFFRAESLQQALNILNGMAGLNGFVIPSSELPSKLISIVNLVGIDTSATTPWNFEGSREFYSILVAFLICCFLPNSIEFTKRMDFTKRQWLTVAFVSAVALMTLMSFNKVSEFLYFQF